MFNPFCILVSEEKETSNGIWIYYKSSMRNSHCFLTHFVVACLEKRHMGEFARLHHVFSIHIPKKQSPSPPTWPRARVMTDPPEVRILQGIFARVNSSAKKCSRTDSAPLFRRQNDAKCLRALGKKVDVVWMVVPKVCLQVDQLGVWTQFEKPQNPVTAFQLQLSVPTLSPPCGSLAEIFLEAEAWQRRGPANSKRFQVDGATCHGHLSDGLTTSRTTFWQCHHWVCIHQYPSYFIQNSTPKTKISCQRIVSLFPQKAGNLMVSVSPTEATMPRQWQVHLECPSTCAHTPQVWITSVREPNRGGVVKCPIWYDLNISKHYRLWVG